MQRRYGDPLPLGEPGGLPYSKGLMARALIAAGVSAERAYRVARRIELDLADRGETSLEFERFEELAAEVLGEEEGRGAAGRLHRYAALQALDVPIVLLVGGATGTGKSTVATEAAHRLGITRVTSTDFIRQTIRAFFSATSCRRCTTRASRRTTPRSRRSGATRCSTASSTRPATSSSASKP